MSQHTTMLRSSRKRLYFGNSKLPLSLTRHMPSSAILLFVVSLFLLSHFVMGVPTASKSVRQIAFDSPLLINMPVIEDVEINYGGVAGGATVFGATIQLAVAQCQPSHDQFVYTPTGLFGQTQNAQLCALWITSPPDTITNFKAEIRTIRFLSTFVSRVQLSFIWIFWADADRVNLLMDAERRHIYGTVSISGSWNDAETSCESVSGWTLASISNRYELQIVSGLATSGTPLGMTRSSPTNPFEWTNSETVVFANWASSMPTYNDANSCVKMNANATTWENIDCATVFTSVVCEYDTSFVTLGGVFSFVAAEVNVSGQTTLPNLVFPINVLADQSSYPTQLIFGASVHVSESQCFQGDKFFLTLSNDWISVVEESDCTIKFAGFLGSSSVSIADYNLILFGLRYKTQLATRLSLSFNLIYWTNGNIREPHGDSNTLHAYAHFSGFKWTAVSYPHHTASAICASVGMYPAEISSVDEADIIRRYQRQGPSFLGMLRNGSGIIVGQTSNVSITAFDRWNAGFPKSSFSCVRAEKFYAYWETADCTQTAGVLCESDSWGSAFVLSQNNTLIPGVVVPAPTRTKLLRIGWIRLFSEEDLTHFSPATEFYGASIEVAPVHCQTGITLALRQPLPTSITSDPLTNCLLTLRGHATFQEYKVALLSINFTSTESLRPQIAFSYILWWNPNMTSMRHDPTTRRSFGVLTTAGSYDVAVDSCSKNSFFTLLEPNDAEVANLTNKMIPTGTCVHANIRRADYTQRFAFPGKKMISFTDWDSAQPTSLNDNKDCVMVCQTTTKWSNVLCSTPATIAICQSDIYPFYGHIIYTTPGGAFTTDAYVVQPIALWRCWWPLQLHRAWWWMAKTPRSWLRSVILL